MTKIAAKPLLLKLKAPAARAPAARPAVRQPPLSQARFQSSFEPARTRPDPSKFGDLSNPANLARFQNALFISQHPTARLPDPSKFGDLSNPNNLAKFQNVQFVAQQTTLREEQASALKAHYPASASSFPDATKFGDLVKPSNLAAYQNAVLRWQQQAQSAATGAPGAPAPTLPAQESGGIPDPAKFGDLTQPANMERYQQANLQYQQAMNRLNERFQMLSNLEKSRSDTAKQMAGNIR